MNTICLLCDEPMHEKPVSDSIIDPLKKYKHKEHIIQNAIGGRLKSDSILCESCGGILNNEIDIDFTKLFLLITARITNFAKERNRGANSGLTGIHVDSDLKVKYVNNVAIPIKPTVIFSEDEKKITIYSSKESIKNYRKSIAKQLTDKGKKIEDYVVEEITEFGENEKIWLAFSKDVVDFNDKWKMGFIKIATEFAYLNGVPKDQLTKTLDRENKKLIFSDNLYPYYPATAIDYTLEYNRNLIEKNFPSHTLILFTQSFTNNCKALYCYVELFSTFQYYVMLNDNYNGPDKLEFYSQKTIIEDRAEIDIRGIRYKELQIMADRLGIDLTKSKSKNLEDIYSFLESEYAKKAPVYQLDLKTEISAILNTLNKAIILSRLPVSNLELSIEIVELIEFLKKLPDDKSMKLLKEYQDFFNYDESIIIERFRQIFPKTSYHGVVNTISMVEKSIEKCRDNIEDVQEYGHQKFGFLSYFLNTQ